MSMLRRSFPSRASAAVGLLAALLIASSLGVGTVGAANQTTRKKGSVAAAPAQLKAVFIVGPTGSLTNSNLAESESLAKTAESLGMDVRRVFFPHATWENVLANIQGANLVVYMGHGYGWPSSYTKVITESRQDGMGLNTTDGSGVNQYTYYGANRLKESVTLAPNAIVFLNHLCYSAGNGEPGMSIPSYDLARQRVDNMANGWLAVGARTVFAYGSQLFVKSLKALFETDGTMEDIFRTPGARPTEYYGWVGWDARKFASVRTPGTTNFLDPSLKEGFYRAVSGDLTMTASEWAAGGDTGSAPTLTDLSASTDGAAALVGGNAALFTPNGDGVTDNVDLTYTVDKEAFVDFTVQNGGATVVRSFSSWSPAGVGSTSWDGKKDDGTYVPDGTYTITATPRSRGGQAGSSSSVTVMVLTTMFGPAVSPALFYPSDGDSLASTAHLSVKLTAPATFSWKVVDADGHAVRTNMNNVSVGAGTQTWNWDGRDGSGNYVADGAYYSEMTATTAAGSYSQSLPVRVGAFSLSTVASAPYVRGTQTRVVVYSAEPLTKKPDVKLYLPGLAVKTYGTYKQADGGFYVNVTFNAAATAGTVQFRVTGTDTGAGAQYSDYFFPLN